MTGIKLTKRYPNSRTEDITDAYMRGWNDALDAVQNGKFHISDTPQLEVTREEFEKIAEQIKSAPLRLERLEDYQEPYCEVTDTPQTDSDRK